MREATEEREILTPLTEDEARKLMVDLAREVDREDLLREEKKDTDSDLNKQIKEARTEVRRLSTVIKSKQEKRKQLCRVVYDYEAGKKYIFSPFQPNTIIAVEEMTDVERQLQFPRLAAGETPTAETTATVDAPIVMAGKMVLCAECHAQIEFEKANTREVRDSETNELIRTEYLCKFGHRKNDGEATGGATDVKV